MTISFGVLAVLVVAGLLGPLLATLPRIAPPLVVGEILAGIAIGRSGFDWVDPNDATLVFLASIGFAMLMFIVGTHLPLRDPAVTSSLIRGTAIAATTIALAIPLGLGLAAVVGLHRPAILALLLASTSAAIALPVLQDMAVDGRVALVATAWIAVADAATVLGIPLVMAKGNTARAVVGCALVIVIAAAAYGVARAIRNERLVARLRAASRQRGWALDLRISLVVLFVLAWIAERNGASVLIAGFATGAIVSLLGEPRRVAQQLIGIGEGFFVPLFFVHLGTRLDLGQLARQPRTIGLGAMLLAGSLAVHVLTAALWRVPLGYGLLATAQLGVPSAVVSIGLTTGDVDPAQASAIMAAVLGSLALAAVGATLLGHGERLTDRAAS